MEVFNLRIRCTFTTMFTKIKNKREEPLRTIPAWTVYSMFRKTQLCTIDEWETKPITNTHWCYKKQNLKKN